jgi:beta-N-acetylhexosaminidase
MLAAAFGAPATAVAAGDPGHSGDAPYRGKVISLLRHMTLEQKVGQLFLIEVAGRDANVVSDAARAVNYTTHQVESLVRVLFGEVDPVGRLPVSIPRADGTGVLFPFGHGLGY